jgi:hypothetical protein
MIVSLPHGVEGAAVTASFRFVGSAAFPGSAHGEHGEDDKDVALPCVFSSPKGNIR